MEKYYFYLRHGLWNVVSGLLKEDGPVDIQDKLFAEKLLLSAAEDPHSFCFASQIIKYPWQQSWLASFLLQNLKISGMDKSVLSLAEVEIMKKEAEFQSILNRLSEIVPGKHIIEELLHLYNLVIHAERENEPVPALSTEAHKFICDYFLQDPVTANTVLQHLLCVWCPHFKKTDDDLQNIYSQALELCIVELNQRTSRTRIEKSDTTDALSSKSTEDLCGLVLCILSIFKMSEEEENSFLENFFPSLLSLSESGVLPREQLFMSMVSRKRLKMAKMFMDLEDRNSERNSIVSNGESLEKVYRKLLNFDDSIEIEEMFLRVVKREKHWTEDFVASMEVEQLIILRHPSLESEGENYDDINVEILYKDQILKPLEEIKIMLSQLYPLSFRSPPVDFTEVFSTSTQDESLFNNSNSPEVNALTVSEFLNMTSISVASRESQLNLSGEITSLPGSSLSDKFTGSLPGACTSSPNYKRASFSNMFRSEPEVEGALSSTPLNTVLNNKEPEKSKFESRERKKSTRSIRSEITNAPSGISNVTVKGSNQGFVCNRHIVRNILQCLKDCSLETNSAIYSTLSKENANQKNLIIESSIPQDTVQEHIKRLLQYINDAAWRLELLTGMDIASGSYQNIEMQLLPPSDGTQCDWLYVSEESETEDEDDKSIAATNPVLNRTQKSLFKRTKSENEKSSESGSQSNKSAASSLLKRPGMYFDILDDSLVVVLGQLVFDLSVPPDLLKPSAQKLKLDLHWDGTVRHPEVAVRSLLADVLQVIQEQSDNFVGFNKSTLHYHHLCAIAKNTNVKLILMETQELSVVDVNLLSPGDETFVFYVNLANLMWIHGVIALEVMSSMEKTSPYVNSDEPINCEFSLCQNFGLYSSYSLERQISRKCIGYNVGQLGFISLHDVHQLLLGELSFRPASGLKSCTALGITISQKTQLMNSVSTDPRVLFALINEHKQSPKLQLNLDSRELVIPELLQLYQDYVLLNQEPEIVKIAKSAVEFAIVLDYGGKECGEKEVKSTTNNSGLLENVWKHRKVEEPVIKFLERHCWMLSLLVQRIQIEKITDTSQLVQQPALPMTDKRTKCLEQLFRSEWVKKLKACFHNNSVVAALQSKPDKDELWSLLNISARKQKWTLCADILWALPETDLMNDPKLQIFHDIVCLLWLELHDICTKAAYLIDAKFFHDFFESESSDFTTALKLLLSAPIDHSTAVCRQLIPLLKSIPCLRFLTNFLLNSCSSYLSAKEIEEYQMLSIGIQMLAILTPAEQSQNIELIWHPDLLIEQYIMNTRLEVLHKMVSGYRSLSVRVCDDCYQQMEYEQYVNETSDDHPPFSLHSEDSLNRDFIWKLSEDETHNSAVREEFSFEHAPSVSLSLAVAAKMSYSKAGLITGIEQCDDLLRRIDLLNILVKNGCSALIPVERLKSHSLRRLRDHLIQQELWTLALDVSTKNGLDCNRVWATWGKACLRAGCWKEAWEKFTHCFDKVSNTTRPVQNPLLLNDIIQILEEGAYSVDHRVVEQAEKIRISKIAKNVPLSTQALSILHTLSALKEISQGKYLQGTPPINTVVLGPKLDHTFYNECCRYLMTYGSHSGIISFYLRHDDLTTALRHILTQKVEPEFIICLFNLNILQVYGIAAKKWASERCHEQVINLIQCLKRSTSLSNVNEVCDDILLLYLEELGREKEPGKIDHIVKLITSIDKQIMGNISCRQLMRAYVLAAKKSDYEDDVKKILNAAERLGQMQIVRLCKQKLVQLESK
ncbi:hypothetical protein C0J52_07758 [Blattella germanica]|nr:hypothetical protein C0J52_07758 [Blattella germanica]